MEGDPFTDPLDGSVSIHFQNLLILVTEMFKRHINEAPPIFSSFFECCNTTYNLANVKKSQFYMLELFLTGQKVNHFGIQKYGNLSQLD